MLGKSFRSAALAPAARALARHAVSATTARTPLAAQRAPVFAPSAVWGARAFSSSAGKVAIIDDLKAFNSAVEEVDIPSPHPAPSPHAHPWFHFLRGSPPIASSHTRSANPAKYHPVAQVSPHLGIAWIGESEPVRAVVESLSRTSPHLSYQLLETKAHKLLDLATHARAL